MLANVNESQELLNKQLDDVYLCPPVFTQATGTGKGNAGRYGKECSGAGHVILRPEGA